MPFPGQLGQRLSKFRDDDERNLQFVSGMFLRLPLISLYFRACVLEYPTPLDLSLLSTLPEMGLFLLTGAFDYTIITLLVWLLQATISKSTNLRLELQASIAASLVRMHLVGWTTIRFCLKKLRYQENRPFKAILFWIKTCPAISWIFFLHWTGITPVALRSWIVSILRLYLFGQWDFIDVASFGTKQNTTSLDNFWSWNTVLRNLRASAIGVPVQMLAQYIPALILLGVTWVVRVQSGNNWQGGIDAFVAWLRGSSLMPTLRRMLSRLQESVLTTYNVQLNTLSRLTTTTYKSLIQKIPWVSPHTRKDQSPASGKRIRLLKVHAAGLKNLIECTLDWHELGPSLPQYTAVSYVWGSPDKCYEITINGRPFKTTASAAGALLALRSSWTARTFWIDAICIDQDDDSDKERQIPYMAEIYEKAFRVVVWLGDAEDGHMATGLARKLWFRSSLAREFGGSLIVNDINADAWKALGTMLNQPWFRRVWIIQEVVVAKGGDLGGESVIIRYGHGTIDWKTLSWFTRECLGNRNVLENLTGNDYTSTISNVRAIEEFRSVYRREGPNLSFLFYLGRLFRSDLKFEATVAKDKVYSLLNLTSQGSSSDAAITASKALVPNYQQSDSQLFTSIADYLFRTLPFDHRLDVLAHAGLLPGNRTPNLPSWVPDWDAQPVSLPFIGLDGTKELLSHVTLSSRFLAIAAMRSYGDFSLNKMLGQIVTELENNASKISDVIYHAGSPRIKKYSTPNIHTRQLRHKPQMCVAGIGIGRVAHLASQFSPIGTPLKITRDGSLRLNPAAFLPRDWLGFASKHSSRWILDYGRAVLGELTQTWIELTGENIPSREFVAAYSLAAKVPQYESFLDVQFARISTEQDFFVDDREHPFYLLDRSIRTMCSGRVLGVTDGGRLGLFPAGTRVGDAVCVLVDASVPFVLRAVGGEVGEDGVYEVFHHLVGPCYAQGVMYGEALNNVLAKDIGWFKLE